MQRMKTPTKQTRPYKGRHKLTIRKIHLMGRRHTIPLPRLRMCQGTFNEYPCTMTINDLSTNSVSLLPGVYITTTRCYEMEEIRTRLSDLETDFWDRLRICGKRKLIVASDHTSAMAFCSWASLPFNCKLISVFIQDLLDTMTVTISDGCIMCNALNLNSFTAKTLLDTLACVALASGLFDPKLIGDTTVNVTTTDIDNFYVCMTVRLSPSYLRDVKIDTAHLNAMYGHIVANLV